METNIWMYVQPDQLILCFHVENHNLRLPLPSHPTPAPTMLWQDIQSDLNNSNTDDSFTMAHSNLFLSRKEILSTLKKPIFEEIFLFFHEIVYLCTH